MANITYGWPNAVANNADAGDVAWTNAPNAKVSDNAYATAAIAAASPTTQYLQFTDFLLNEAIPATATIVGIQFVTEAKTSANTVHVKEAKAIKGGTKSTTNLAASDAQSVSTFEGATTRFGDSAQLWGETWAVADIDSTFGLALQYERDSNDVTISVDSCYVVIHWTDTPAAVVTVNKATTPMAPCAIHMHAGASVIGTSRWERVGVRWEITGPEGWTMTATDPRPGSWGASRSVNCATDGWGYNYAIWANVAGDYGIKCYIYLEDGTVLESSTTTVTVAADTRTVRYLDPNATGTADGTSWANAWTSWNTAIAALANDTRLMVKDATSWAGTNSHTNRTLSAKSNVVIQRSNDGASRPILTVTGNYTLLAITDCTDVALDGIDFRSDGSNYNYALNPGGSNNTRLSVVNCVSSSYINSFYEVADGGTIDRLLVYNCDFQGIRRYGIYLGGQYGRDIVYIGTRHKIGVTSNGEGLWRFEGHSDTRYYGMRVNLLWCTSDSNATAHNLLRLAWPFTHVYQSKALDGTLNFSEVGGGDDSSVGIQMVKRYDGLYLDTDRQPGLSDRIDGLFVCNSYMYGSLANIGLVFNFAKSLGKYLNCSFVNNIFATVTYIDHNFFTTTGTGMTIRNLVIKNNIFTMDSLTGFRALWFRDTGSMWTGGQSNGNAFPYTGRTNLFKVANVDKTLAQWNAYSSNPTVGTDLEVDDGSTTPLVTADMVSSNNFKPSEASFPDIYTLGLPEPGVWVDYSGALRDHDAVSWPAGVSSSTATAYTLTGPAGDLTRNTQSGNFTVTPNGEADGDIVVTPSDGGAGGVFNPTSVTFLDGDDSAKTFKYTPRAAGGASVTISVTNDGGLTDPADVTKDVNVVLTQFRITGTPTLIVAAENYVIDTEQAGNIS